MTTEQVPLATQIEKVQREIRYAQEDGAEKAERLWSAVLASLQRLGRLTAADGRIARLEEGLRRVANINNGPDQASAEWRCLEASAIAGYALIAATPTGTG